MARLIQTLLRTSLLYNLYVSVLIGLFAASILIEKGQDVLFINGLHTYFLDFLFSALTNFGDGIIFLFIFLVTLFIRFQHSVSVVIICIANGIIVNLFKHVFFPNVARPRKFIDNSLLHFVPNINVHTTHSFPSGHTVTAFCAALFLTLLFRHRILGMVCLLMAVLVGTSRIYLLQHFLMDVSAGALIGCVTTYIVWQSMNANQKPGWMSNRIKISYKLRKPSLQITSAS